MTANGGRRAKYRRAIIWSLFGGFVGLAMFVLSDVCDPGNPLGLLLLFLPGAFFGWLFGIASAWVGGGAAVGGIGGAALGCFWGIWGLGFLGGATLGAIAGEMLRVSLRGLKR